MAVDSHCAFITGQSFFLILKERAPRNQIENVHLLELDHSCKNKTTQRQLLLEMIFFPPFCRRQYESSLTIFIMFT